MVWLCSAVLILLYGWILLAASLKAKGLRLEGGEVIVWSAAFTTVILAVISMVLALMGKFWAPLVLFLYALLVTILGGFCHGFSWIKKARINGGKKVLAMASRHSLLLLILILASVLYLGFPTYYLLTGRDYGLYFLNAIHTAETGSTQYEMDEFLEENYQEVQDILEIGYPALFSSYEDGISDNPGEINAQFLPLYWVIGSLAYSLCGIGGLVRVSGLITLIALSLLYFFAYRYFNRTTAIWATLFLTLCPAQIWGARITQSEQLAQLLFLLMAWLFAYGWSEKNKKILILAGIVVGIGCFCRADNYLVGIGLLFMGIYVNLFHREVRRAMVATELIYMLSVALSLVYGFHFHYHYYADLWGRGYLRLLVMANVALFVLYLLVYAITVKLIFEKNPVEKALMSPRNGKILAGILGLLLFFLYFVRPLLWPEVNEASSLIQYSWYFCPLLLIFLVYGFYRLAQISTSEEFFHLEAITLFLGIGMASFLLYTVNPSVYMDHYWMSRRWLPINFPFVILLGTYGISRMREIKIRGGAWGRRIARISLVAVLIYLGIKDKDIWNQSAYAGILDDYEKLCSAIPEDALVLTNSENCASVLKYLYDKDVYIIKDDIDESDLQAYLQEHDNVYYMGSLSDETFFWEICFSLVYQGVVDGVAPERVYGSYPTAWISDTYCVNLYYLQAEAVDVVDLEWYLYCTEACTHTDEGLMISGTGNALFYGPYLTLEEGTYFLSLSWESETEGVIGQLEVVVDEEVVQIIELVNEKQSCSLCVEMEGEGTVQFRFNKTGEGDLCVSEIFLGR